MEVSHAHLWPHLLNSDVLLQYCGHTVVNWRNQAIRCSGNNHEMKDWLAGGVFDLFIQASQGEKRIIFEAKEHHSRWLDPMIPLIEDLGNDQTPAKLKRHFED
jgi:hypothetical protein